MVGVLGMWLFGIAAAFTDMQVRVVPQAAQAVPVGLAPSPQFVTPLVDQGSSSGSAWVAPVAMLAVAAVATSARKVAPGPRRVPKITMFKEGDIGVLPPL